MKNLSSQTKDIGIILNSTYPCLAMCIFAALTVIQKIPIVAAETESTDPSSEVENFPNASTVSTELESVSFSAKDLLPVSPAVDYSRTVPSSYTIDEFRFISPVVAESESAFPSSEGEDFLNVPTVVAEVESDPSSPYAGDIWTRSGLTGDWGGGRTFLYQNGLDININLIQFYQGVVSGGENQEDTYFGVAEYRMILDTEKAQLWSGGITVVQGESYFGQTIDDSVGALLSARHRYVVQAGAGNGTYLTFFNHTQKFSDTFSLTFGKMPFPGGDVNDFAFGIGDIQFLNIALQQNPVNLILAAYSALGTTLTFTPTDNVTLKISAYDADGRIDRAGFDTVFNGNTNYIADARFTTNFFGRLGHQTIGFFYSTADRISLANSQIVTPKDAEPTVLTPNVRNAWTVYYNFDQYITDTWGVFGRFGISDGDANPFDYAFALGISGQGLFPGREDDRFGIGYYYASLNDTTFLSDLFRSNEQGVEVFYNMAVTPWFQLTGDLQVIWPGVKGVDTATILGLRGRLTF